MKKLLAALLAAPLLAYAQAYPTKPVRIVLPFGPGGVADITTRTIAPKLSEGLGQQVVVENMPGAGGIRAAEAVAKADPDGHTLLLLTNGNAVSQALFKSLPYDPVNDFSMISTVGFFSMVIVTGANSKYKTLQEFIGAAKKNKDEAAAQLSAAARAWQQGEADRMKAAQEEWGRHKDALSREIDRNRSAAEQLEATLLALKEQSVAKERDAEARLEQIKREAEHMLRNARSEWQREVANRLESAGVQILAVFDSSATA